MSQWVLLRGLSRQQGHWGVFAERLQELTQQPVLLEDLPGFGTRCAQTSPQSVPRIAEAIADAVLRVNTPINLLGMSMGGMVALELVQRWPDHFNCLVMVNSSFRPYARLHQRLRPTSYPKVLKALLHPQHQQSEAQVLHLSSRMHGHNAELLHTWTQLRDTATPSRLAVLNQFIAAGRFFYDGPKPLTRVLLLASLKDQLVNPICSQKIAKAWDTDLLLHPQAGHDLALDAPEWLAQSIADWL